MLTHSVLPYRGKDDGEIVEEKTLRYLELRQNPDEDRHVTTTRKTTEVATMADCFDW